MISGIRKPPAPGSSDPNEFWNERTFSSFCSSSLRFARRGRPGFLADRLAVLADGPEAVLRPVGGLERGARGVLVVDRAAAVAHRRGAVRRQGQRRAPVAKLTALARSTAGFRPPPASRIMSNMHGLDLGLDVVDRVGVLLGVHAGVGVEELAGRAVGHGLGAEELLELRWVARTSRSPSGSDGALTFVVTCQPLPGRVRTLQRAASGSISSSGTVAGADGLHGLVEHAPASSGLARS